MIARTVTVNKEGKRPGPWGSPVSRGQGDEEKPAKESKQSVK